MLVVAILEAMADRGVIEQLFKDVKEVWGAGQQPVRNVYASIGAFTVNLVLYSVVEVCCQEGSGAGRVFGLGYPPARFGRLTIRIFWKVQSKR